MDRQASSQIDAETRSIVDRIVKYRRPRRVILFGSRGRGNAREDSDVDLCVLYERLGKQNVDVMEELYLDLFGHMPHPVDLVVHEEASFIDRSRRPNSFESIIDAEGVTVYGENKNTL
jgi:predicted nucleotidyltransferase